MVGGVAGGVSAKTGVDVTVVRVVFVLLALLSGFGVAAYVLAWLVLPVEEGRATIASRAVADRVGLALVVALLPFVVLAAVGVSLLHIAVLAAPVWPFFIAVGGLILVWRNADDEERAWLHRVAEPVLTIGPAPRSRRWFALRLGVGALFLAVGVGALALGRTQPTAVQPFGGAVLVAAGVVVLLGPWWLRLARDLAAERQARARAEERADIAARVHDSVLQTLALIQRSADRPQKVVQLARAQERELRRWLLEGLAPGTAGGEASTLSTGVRAVAEEVEAAYGTSVEVITVGDCPLDDDVGALLDAAREATVNAAKWSGAPVVTLFSEVERRGISAFVRDRGKGFDPGQVGEDRRGLTESVTARMRRHGGTATIRSTPGEGTEVELHLPRASPRG